MILERFLHYINNQKYHYIHTWKKNQIIILTKNTYYTIILLYKHLVDK